MENVRSLLNGFLPNREWQIEKPATGWRKESYIVESRAEKYFLKFDVPVNILVRLGEIRVAPRVLFSGEDRDRTFVIQEFVHGTPPPDRRWMQAHPGQLTRIVRLYHEDALLTGLLASTHPTVFHEHITRDLDWLCGRFSAPACDALRTAYLASSLGRLVASAATLEPVPLVPIHNDPSPTNILVTGDRLLFLDWDEVTLSDPLRDIGLLLWWNYPPDEWPRFLALCDMELTDATVAKIHWFAARASLDIAMWHAEHGLDGSRFIEDFMAALNDQPNPKAPWGQTGG